VREATAHEAIQRLRRVEGQIRGLQAMVEQGRTCEEIAVQLSAALVALRRVAGLIMACSMAEAAAEAVHEGRDPADATEDLVTTFARIG
jgi:DNA-binding FrmR family transcriptional regulator